MRAAVARAEDEGILQLACGKHTYTIIISLAIHSRALAATIAEVFVEVKGSQKAMRSLPSVSLRLAHFIREAN